MRLISFGVFFIFFIISLECLTACVDPDFDYENTACYTCSSDLEPKCVTDPTSVKSCRCQNKEDKCVVGLRGAVTVRGCAKETLSLTNTKSCERTNCNSDEFPLDRLSCYQCQNCVNATNLQKCVKYLPHDKCYTKISKNGETTRGCRSDLPVINEPVYFCNGSGCNNLASVTKLSCTFCNSKENRFCDKVSTSGNCAIEPVHTCEMVIIRGQENSACYTYRGFGYVQRGCMKELPPYPEYFKMYDFCGENFCNNKCIDPVKCFISSPHLNANAMTIIVDQQPQVCPGTNRICHACINPDGSFYRGCGYRKNSELCFYCQDMNGCNNPTPLQCYSCDSKSDPNCAQWTNPTAIGTQFCSSAEDVCATYIHGKDTIRGCFKDLDCNNPNITCMSCSTNLCNVGVFPTNRRRCHICSKTKDCAGAQDPKRAVVCPDYDRNADCITFADSNNEMTRSCSTDEVALKQCESTGAPKCKLCNTDGCNSVPLMLDPVLSCIKCKGPACAWGQRKESALKCVNKFPYYLQETCITKIADKEVERGCSFDVGTCADNDCKMCDKDGCNIQMRATQKCIQCNSSNQNETSCGKSAEGILGSNCSAGFILYEQRGCYTKLEGKVITRGCASDLIPKALEDCKSDDNKACDTCAGDNCNNYPAPGLSAHLAPMIEVLVTLILLVAFLK